MLIFYKLLYLRHRCLPWGLWTITQTRLYAADVKKKQLFTLKSGRSAHFAANGVRRRQYGGNSLRHIWPLVWSWWLRPNGWGRGRGKQKIIFQLNQRQPAPCFRHSVRGSNSTHTQVRLWGRRFTWIACVRVTIQKAMSVYWTYNWLDNSVMDMHRPGVDKQPKNK